MFGSGVRGGRLPRGMVVVVRGALSETGARDRRVPRSDHLSLDARSADALVSMRRSRHITPGACRRFGQQLSGWFRLRVRYPRLVRSVRLTQPTLVRALSTDPGSCRPHDAEQPGSSAPHPRPPTRLGAWRQRPDGHSGLRLLLVRLGARRARMAVAHAGCGRGHVRPGRGGGDLYEKPKATPLRRRPGSIPRLERTDRSHRAGPS